MTFDELYNLEASIKCFQALKLLFDEGHDISDYRGELHFQYGNYFNIVDFIFNYAAPKLFKNVTILDGYGDEHKEKKLDILNTFNSSNRDFFESEYFLVIHDSKIIDVYENFESIRNGAIQLEYNQEKNEALLRIDLDDVFELETNESLEDLIYLSQALQGGKNNEVVA
ncbi:hypothetical protein M3603_15115 [Rummeliibacillus stabekisii]|uniref:hypothetical protein n=1 Tax=Rummeliibacillus stabekisii TaxID=241244 RepID=UPI00203F0F48|nr:hypothetical protein [Rummeliibacillus stabekisii]MCM3317948.1 hypothetical protein [Rummeliibacillus stabekisii]